VIFPSRLKCIKYNKLSKLSIQNAAYNKSILQSTTCELVMEDHSIKENKLLLEVQYLRTSLVSRFLPLTNDRPMKAQEEPKAQELRGPEQLCHP
jgi:hypothetical protein